MINEPTVSRQEFGLQNEPDYEVVAYIGRGSYGDVYLTRGRKGGWYAVKVIYRVSFEEVRTYEREYNGIVEFQPISKQSESQLQVVEVGRHDHAGRYYYIMEVADDVNRGRNIDPSLYQPRTLKTEIQRRGPLPVQECLEIGLHLTEALANLHAHKLIHRDIKPANIIFVNGRAKLADVGLVTREGFSMSCAGTEGFIPREGPGFAGDVFALGKVLYEMWTGFDRLRFPDLPENIDTRADHRLVLELNHIITRACQTDIDKRYKTSEDMRRDLRKVLSGGSARTGPLRSFKAPLALGACAAAAFLIFRMSHPPSSQESSASLAGSGLSSVLQDATALPSNSASSQVTQENQPSASDFTTEVDLLRQAWNQLRTGRRVYAGLRERAQRQTQLAAHELGVNFKPSGEYSSSNVGESDDNLREAKASLDKVLDLLQKKKHAKAVPHVQAAIHRINEALAKREK